MKKIITLLVCLATIHNIANAYLNTRTVNLKVTQQQPLVYHKNNTNDCYELRTEVIVAGIFMILPPL